MNRRIDLVECPRDAWQALPRLIPAEVKAAYLRTLVDAGFMHLDAVSFVSPAAVPQMADSEQVLSLLGPAPGVDILGIVVNEQGVERAMRTGAVSSLGFPYSISPTFLARNQKQTMDQARRTLEAIARQSAAGGLNVVAYISMAFGNPYGDPWEPQMVIDACLSLQDLGIGVISLADTVGIAGPGEIFSLISLAASAMPGVQVGAHLHARRDQSAEKVSAAYRAGCRRLDMAIGGLGGCPFAQDALVGNIATELALTELRSLGLTLPQVGPLDELLTMSSSIADRFGSTA